MIFFLNAYNQALNKKQPNEHYKHQWKCGGVIVVLVFLRWMADQVHICHLLDWSVNHRLLIFLFLEKFF